MSRPGERDRSLVGRLEPGDHPQGGRLAGARRAEQGEELPAGDREVDAVDRHDVAEHLANALEPHVGRLGGCRGLRLGRGRRPLTFPVVNGDGCSFLHSNEAQSAPRLMVKLYEDPDGL